MWCLNNANTIETKKELWKTPQHHKFYGCKTMLAFIYIFLMTQSKFFASLYASSEEIRS